MYLIRKISPWQDQSKLYNFGNPPVLLTNTAEEAKQVKEKWEVAEMKKIGITQHFEYWDVDNTKELIAFDNFLRQTYNIQILNQQRNEDCIGSNDVIPTTFPNHFSQSDYLIVQKEMNRFHYKIEKIKTSNKFIILFNNDHIGFLNDESGLASSIKFELHETYEEAKNILYSKIIGIYERSGGSHEISGPIKTIEFNDKTLALLKQTPEFKHESDDHAYGQRIISNVKLSEIENGVEKLLDIFQSFGRQLFEIRQINS